MDPLDAQIRQVFFYDTPDLRLNAAGLVVRSRRVQGKGGDTVIKLRPSPARVAVARDAQEPERRRRSGRDAGRFRLLGLVQGRHAGSTTRARCRSATPRSSRCSRRTRRRSTAAHAPEGLDLNDLVVLGPITLLKGKFTLDDFDRPIVAEMWLYPNGSRILELSTKALPSEAWQKAAETRLALSARGIKLTGEQQTKTKTALDYFAKLAKEAAAEAAAASAPAKPARAPRRKAPASA